MTPRILLVCFVLCGCNKTTSPEPSPELEAYRGEQRIALFRECMAAAAKIERKADDDVSDIVEECSTQAYYQSNGIMRVSR